MGKIFFILAALFITGTAVSGCAEHNGSNNGTSVLNTVIATEPDTSEYDVYTADWLMEMSPAMYGDYTEEDILCSFRTHEWVRSQEEYQEYIHDPSEYWDEDGNFVNPAPTAYDEGWICGAMHIYMDVVAASSIPQEVLDKLDTAQLLDIANNERVIPNACALGGISRQRTVLYMDAIAKSSTYSEFLERPDYAKVLYDYYAGIDPEDYIGDDGISPIQSGTSFKKVCTIAFNEMTIVTDKFFDSLNDEQRRNIIDKKNEIIEYVNEHDYDGEFDVGRSWMWMEGKDSVFDAMIETGISPKWSAFVQNLE